MKFFRNNTLTMTRTSALGDGILANSDCLTFPATNPFNQAHIAGTVSMFELDYSPSRGTGVGTVNYQFEFSDVLSTQGYMVFSDFDFREEIRIKAYKANGDLIPYSEMIMKRENGQFATGSSYLNTKFDNIGSSFSGVLTTWNDNNVSNPVVTLQSIHPIKRVVFEINLNVAAANDSKTMRFNFANPTSPAIVYVNHSAVGLNNGTSWSNAYTSFQAGYENSFSGDQLWVAKGTYRPSSTHYLSNLVDRNKHFRIPERVEVYGGFAGTETAVSQRVNFGYGEANNTLLSGDLLGDDNYSLVPWTGSVENTYHVIYQPNEASCALNDITLLDGFSISGGYADGTGTNNNNDGAGLFINDHSPRLKNIDLVNNFSTDNGGGMYLALSQSVIENITAKFNRAETSTGDGGGVFLLNSSPQLTNCLIVDNLAQVDGGGIYVSGSKPILTNATIAYNSSSDEGGGVYITSASSTDTTWLRNSILWGNSAVNLSNQLFRSATALLALQSTTYSNSTNDITTGFAISDNTLTTDPQFFDVGMKDYRLRSTSPSLESGNDIFNTLTTDIRRGNFSRKLLKTNNNLTGTIDRGAFEYNNPVDFNSELLPVVLVDFQANRQGVKTQLTWSTATEYNNKGFYVQRSTNSIHFTNLGFVAARGNGTGAQYSFTDQVPVSGRNFYRLLQEDKDGKTSLSKVRQVNFEGQGLRIYPNPVQKTGTLTLQAANQPLRLRLTDVHGRVFKIWNYSQTPAVLQLELQEIQSGHYLLEVLQGLNDKKVLPIIKQ